jgi:hypothetical protein
LIFPVQRTALFPVGISEGAVRQGKLTAVYTSPVKFASPRYDSSSKIFIKKSATNGRHNIHNSHFTIQKADPLLAFSIRLARTELPSLTEAMASAVRVLIEGFLDGTLAYPDVHKLAIE